MFYLCFFRDKGNTKVEKTILFRPEIKATARNHSLCIMKPIQIYFSELEDFRIEKKCLHKLSDILLIGLFTYLSNGEDYEDMVLFAKTHGDFLKSYVLI